MPAWSRLAGNRCGKCRPSGWPKKVVDTTAAGRLLQRRLPGRSPDRRRCRIRRQTRTPDRQHGDPVSRGDHPAGEAECRSNSPHKALSGRRWRAGGVRLLPRRDVAGLAVGVNRIGAAASRRGRRIRRHQFFRWPAVPSYCIPVRPSAVAAPAPCPASCWRRYWFSMSTVRELRNS